MKLIWINMRQFIKERRNYEKMINTSHIHLVNWEICLTCDNGLALKMLESYFQTVFFFVFFAVQQMDVL